MTTTVYVLRTFGGVLILQVTPPAPTTPNATFYVRGGAASFVARSGSANVAVRGA